VPGNQQGGQRQQVARVHHQPDAPDGEGAVPPQPGRQLAKRPLHDGEPVAVGLGGGWPGLDQREAQPGRCAGQGQRSGPGCQPRAAQGRAEDRLQQQREEGQPGDVRQLARQPVAQGRLQQVIVHQQKRDRRQCQRMQQRRRRKAAVASVRGRPAIR
jgi:hypothetical protein